MATFRDLQLGFDQGAQLNFGRNQAEAVAQQTPQQKFSGALLDMLKQYQSLGTKPFQQQELAARETQNQRISAQTSPDLIGASPGLQAGVRSAEAGALDPTITGAQQAGQTFGEQLKSFSTNIGTARDIIKDFENAEAKRRDDARLAIDKALTQVGGEAFEGADPKELSQLEKLAGYPTGYLSSIKKTLKQRELELKKTFSSTIDLGNSVGVLDQQGNLLRTIPKNQAGGGTTTRTSGGAVVNPKTGQPFKFDTREDIDALPVSDLTKSIIGGYGDAKTLTPSDKARVQTELYQVGFNPFESINRKLDGLVKTWETVNPKAKGLLQGRIPFLTSASATAAGFETEKKLLAREVARLRDVGVLSDQDVKTYNDALPDRSDRNKSVVEAKVAGAKRALGGGLIGAQNQQQTGGNTVQYQGKTYQFPTPEAANQFKQKLGIQ